MNIVALLMNPCLTMSKKPWLRVPCTCKDTRQFIGDDYECRELRDKCSKRNSYNNRSNVVMNLRRVVNGLSHYFCHDLVETTGIVLSGDKVSHAAYTPDEIRQTSMT